MEGSESGWGRGYCHDSAARFKYIHNQRQTRSQQPKEEAEGATISHRPPRPVERAGIVAKRVQSSALTLAHLASRSFAVQRSFDTTAVTGFPLGPLHRMLLAPSTLKMQRDKAASTASTRNSTRGRNIIWSVDRQRQHRKNIEMISRDMKEHKLPKCPRCFAHHVNSHGWQLLANANVQIA